jgi:hypothetical protein
MALTFAGFLLVLRKVFPVLAVIIRRAKIAMSDSGHMVTSAASV